MKGDPFQAGTHWDRLPEKVEGRHRWVLVTSYTVTDEEMANVAEGIAVLMDEPHLLDVGPGCIDCEQPYSSVKGQRCKAPAYQP